MTVQQIIETEKIQTIEQLFRSHPEVWCRRQAFLGENQMPCEPSKAVYCCLVGAVDLIYPDEGRSADVFEECNAVLSDYPKGWAALGQFNDAQASVEPVIELVRKAKV